MAFTFATSGAMVFKAGKNVDSNIKASGAFLSQISDEIEDYIVNVAGVDLISKYANLTSNGKKILGDIASNMGGMMLIQYDMSGYTSRAEAEIMLDILDEKVNKGLALIKEDRIKAYLAAT